MMWWLLCESRKYCLASFGIEKCACQKLEDVVRHITTSNMFGHCFDSMQQLTTYMRGQYTLYDEFSFWRGECRNDYQKLRERLMALEEAVDDLRRLTLKESPAVSPTRILENGYSQDIQNCPTKPSEWLAFVLCGHAPSLRKLPCKDLTDVFFYCNDVEESQLLPINEESISVQVMSLAPRGRGPKGARGNTVPARDCATTPSSSQGKLKRSKAICAPASSIYCAYIMSCIHNAYGVPQILILYVC